MENLSSATKVAIVTSVVALLFNPISGAIGYYLNDYLSRPKLEIIDGQVYVNTVNKKIEIPEFDAFKSDLYLVMAYKLFADHQCTKWIEEGTFADRGCNKVITRSLTRLSEMIGSEINVYKENIVRLEKWNGNIDTLRLDSTYLDSPTESYRSAQKDKKLFMKTLEIRVLEYKRRLDVVNVLSGYIGKLFSEESERSGKGSVSVSILNRGNADGAIFSHGEVLIKNTSVAIRFSEQFIMNGVTRYSSPVIEAHSLNKIYFHIDEMESTKAAIDEFEGYLKMKSREDFVIKIQSTAGEVEFKGILPP